jgi:hypothetical protein
MGLDPRTTRLAEVMTPDPITISRTGLSATRWC